MDAVHFAPHSLIDVGRMGCDYLLCSPYKFFGPHQGLLWGKGQRMANIPVAKLRVSSEEMPFRWMTGTQSHEGMAGTKAAIDHIAWIGRENLSKQEVIEAGMRGGLFPPKTSRHRLSDHLPPISVPLTRLLLPAVN